MNTSSWRSKAEERPWYAPAYSLVSDIKHETIIEFGSGLGEFAKKISEGKNDLTCLDIDKEYVKSLKIRGYKAKTADFNSKLDFKQSTFDGAICLEVLEHIVNAEFFLSEIHRILKDNGWLLLSTPNIAWIGYRIRHLFGDVPPREGYHYRFFNNSYLKKIIEDKGYRIIKESSITPLPLSRIFFKKPIWIKPKVLQNLFVQDIIILARKI